MSELTIHHEELSIEVQFDHEPAQNGGRTDPSWEAKDTATEWKIEETLDNMDILMGLVNTAIEEDFEFCSVFVCDKTNMNVLIVDYCGMPLELIYVDCNELYSWSILDNKQNTVLIQEALEREIENQDHPDA